MDPHTGASLRICTDRTLCGDPVQPRSSANGLAIAFTDSASSRVGILGPDGTCLWCMLGAPLSTLHGSHAAFTANGNAVTFVGGPTRRSDALWEVRLGARSARRLLAGSFADAVWSATGRLAVVRARSVWVGGTGRHTLRLRRLARGAAPAWSPNSARLALERDGWIWVVRVRDGGSRRLVRGSAPVWSPDGARIAYVGADHLVYVVAAGGGRARSVGSLRVRSVAWQPRPTTGGCAPAKGTTILASNLEAVITWSSATTSWYGCLRAIGRRWLLYANGGFGASASLTSVALAGRFAALQFNSGYKAMYCANSASVYDLTTGKSDGLFSLECESPTPPNADSLTVNASGFAAWRATQLRVPHLQGVSCPSVKLCVAVDTAGDVVTSTNPPGGPSAWSVAYIDITALTGVSCPSAGLCVGVDDSGNVATSSNPAGGASQWIFAHLPLDMFGVSCPSTLFCVTVGGANVATSTNPAGGASAWKTISVDPVGSLLGVSCPSTSLCVGVDDFGHVVTSTTPAGGAGAWTVTKVGDGWLNAVSCPTASLCVAVDTAGDVITSTNPTGGPSAWTVTQVEGNCNGNVSGGNCFSGVSCPSVSACVAVDGAGNVITSTNPTGGPSAWTVTRVASAGFSGVSCPSVSACAAVDGAGNVITSSDPTGGGGAWTSALIDPPSCAGTPTCLAAQIYAHDDQGTHLLDEAPPGPVSALANLNLSGNVLTWTHDGAQHQITLK